MLQWPWQKKTDGKRGEKIPVRNDGAPDSTTRAGFCPRCNTQSSFGAIGTLPVTFSATSMVGRDGTLTPVPYDQVAVLICRHCEQGVVVVEEQMTGENTSASRKGGGQIWWRGVHWWPLPGSAEDPAIPSDIQQAFNEACRAIAANCPRAGAVMARRTLEAITIERGESGGTLAKRLQALTDKNMLPPTLADWAKEVRLIGNVGAHFDPLEDVEISDAEQLRDFIQELLSYLYILPSKLADRRAAKSAGKK